MGRNARPWHLVLAAMIALAALGSWWALKVPAPEVAPFSINPDERSHVAVIRYMAERRALPPYAAEFYESVHPPLYHALAALVRSVSPHQDVLVLRLLSVVIGVCVVGAVFGLGRQIVTEWRAACAAAITAVLPATVTAAGSVGNDLLAALLATLALWAMAVYVRHGFAWKRVVSVALFVALACLTKYTALGLLLVAAVAMVGTDGLGRGLARYAFVLAAFGAACGWWFERNAGLYGDPFRSAAEPDVVTFGAGYQGEGIGYAWKATSALGRSSLGIYPPDIPPWPAPALAGVSAVLAVLVVAALASLLGARWRLANAIPVLFALTVLAVVALYQMKHFQPHFRLLLAAIAPLSIALAAGLARLAGMRSPRLAAAGLAAMTAYSVAYIATFPVE